MRTDIPFDEVMKNHKNWDDDVDYINMNKNYQKLKPMIDKFFFSVYPKHPKIFSLIFSEENFADYLINEMIELKVTNLKGVYFTEYSSEERDELIKKGHLSIIPSLLGAISVKVTSNDDYVFVNVFS